jgi:hypothetical protein
MLWNLLLIAAIVVIAILLVAALKPHFRVERAVRINAAG